MRGMSIQWQAAKQYKDILYHKADGIAKVTINRPAKRNAFRPQTVAEMCDAFANAREDQAVGVVLLTRGRMKVLPVMTMLGSGRTSMRSTIGAVSIRDSPLMK